ncbi:pyrroline-5-carboxylate reductase family protein [Paenibacillus larvae]|uniref:pyrroline-5-carboxylate reductase family protein n=1 Tax=Paenibacillus larvae TaxID=1464 RepID=UPI00289D8012|nr:NAD(P)-binding domain-containing protein [Paenibacillus larvae]
MNSSLASKRIAFIGAGAMAEAIIQGLIEKQKAGPGHICVMNNQNKQRLHELQERYGVRTASEPSEKDKMVKEADIVVLTMKPKDVERSFAHLKALLHPGQQIVSVIAGLQIDKMQELFGQKLPIIRTMPNTSCTIGLGVTGMSFSREVTSGQKRGHYRHVSRGWNRFGGGRKSAGNHNRGFRKWSCLCILFYGSYGERGNRRRITR